MTRWVLLLILTFAGCSGSETACTEIGCTDGWTLRITPADAFQPGVYALTTTVDGVETTCSWEFRLACEGGGACIVDGDCTNAVYTAGEVAISYDASPAEVQVELTRGGLLVANETVVPDYVETRPNGPDCEPVCRQAVVALEVP